MDENYTPWFGVLAPEGLPSGDGRMFAPGSLTHRELPLPMSWQPVNWEGHDGSVVVGRIDRIFREGELVYGQGVLFNTPESLEVMRLIESGGLRGVSVDADAAKMTLIDEYGNEVTGESVLDSEPTLRFDSLRICGATIVPIPAFAEAFISLDQATEEGGLVSEALVAAGVSEKSWDGSASRFTVSEYHRSCLIHTHTGPAEDKEHCKLPVREPDGTLSRAGVHAAASRINQVDASANKIQAAKRRLRSLYRELGEEPPESLNAALDAITAAAVTLASTPDLHETRPLSWFEDPGLIEPSPIVVTEEGRVFGHLAAWGTCHIGMAGVCVTPPHSTHDYAYFAKGITETDGGPVFTGVITMDTGHADVAEGHTAAVAHYDNTGLAFADVAVGEDAHGIWVAGAVRPDTPEEKIVALRSAGALSGDWREIGGNLELVAALAVNVPGFPIPRTALAASAGQASLVASGIVTQAESQGDLKEVIKAALDERDQEQADAAAEMAEIRDNLEAAAEMEYVRNKVALAALTREELV